MKKRTLGSPDKWLRTAATVMEALPYLRQFSGKIFVVKYGGHAMGDGKLATQFAQDIVMLKQVGIHPVVVHGGGPQIGEMLKKLAIQSEFVDGLRVTDAPTMQIAEMVLSGSLNKQIVTALQEAGGRAVGISGKDGKLIVARKLTRTKKDPDSNIEKVLDLGFVGEPHQINPEILLQLASSDFIPVVAPVAIGEDGQTYNVNADTAAGAIAGALKASKLLLLTDVSGVLDKEGQLISELNVNEVAGLREDGTITGGMIPKLETCVTAIEQGVGAAHILDGRIPHVLLVETLTEMGVGTMVVGD